MSSLFVLVKVGRNGQESDLLVNKSYIVKAEAITDECTLLTLNVPSIENTYLIKVNHSFDFVAQLLGL